MLETLPAIVDPAQLAAMRHRLLAADAPWVDGHATAGHQGIRAKHNEQIAESSPLARELGDGVLAALERHPGFIAAALPKVVYPPMFNRYCSGMEFDRHIDGAIRRLPSTSQRMRTDLSATLFLSEPDSYDGGELLIEDGTRLRSVKLPAGALVLYPATTVHRVAPVTRGVRLACFFWVQSSVRDAGQRELLLGLDRAIQTLTVEQASEPARVELAGVYHNLLRMWAEV